jgi:SecD/SecF fusion protein
MKQNNLGRFILVLVILAWSLLEMYPLKSGDLIVAFKARANPPAGNNTLSAQYSLILSNIDVLQKTGTNSEYAVLQQAIGTNDIQPYFPGINAKNQLDPKTYILNRIQHSTLGRIKLGLDLQGGTSFLVEMNTNALLDYNTNTTSTTEEKTSQALSQAQEVIRKRIDRFGVAEPTIQSAGGNRILIQLPGLSQADKDAAREQIEKPAFLEFRLVKEDSETMLENSEPIPPGYQILAESDPNPKGGEPIIIRYVVKNKAEQGLAGDIIKYAGVSYGNLGEPEIEFTLTDEAAIAFGKVTRENIGRQLAIVLDGKLCSAPRINSEIDNRGSITGHYTPEEAHSLANVLQNPLRAPLRIVSSSDVDPTLGRDSIKSGIYASLAGIFFVSLFMLGYYRVAGLAANVALITNVIILMGVMCAIGTTLTLPGIAGVVLTVGMAVDANVLIYERIREELAKGKSLRGSIDAGYARAFGTIFDSHVTTLISSIILIFMGTGEIKGFGVTLTIGVAASLFTALVVTRLIFNFMLDRSLIKTLSMTHWIKSSKVDFMGTAKTLFIITWAFVVLSIGFGFTRGEKNLFGIDFLGGDSTIYSFAPGQQVEVDKVRQVLAGLNGKGDQIQYQKPLGSSAQTLVITSPNGTSDKVTAVLTEKFPQAQFKAIGKQEVGGVIGEEILQSAVTASLLALLGILCYVALRYEFSFAVAAVIAVIHDVLFAIGAYCISNALQGRQFNATVVAAILTIIGFSINDKIVIFDRIREDLRLGMRGSFKEIINHALNQTLSRTIITSGTVFLATGSLYAFGGGVINDFAFTFLVGIVVGTYSSIYIASVVVLWWHKGQRPNIGAAVVTTPGSATAKV